MSAKMHGYIPFLWPETMPRKPKCPTIENKTKYQEASVWKLGFFFYILFFFKREILVNLGQCGPNWPPQTLLPGIIVKAKLHCLDIGNQ